MSVTYNKKVFTTFINKKEIESILKKLSSQINRDFTELHVIIILNGAFMFGSDLVKKLTNVKTINFMKISSYEGMKSTGKINVKLDIAIDLIGKDVLIIEDIVDTGLTMNYLCKKLYQRNPKSLNICSLLLKAPVFLKHINKYEYYPKEYVKYIGKSIKDKFVIGYGLDYNQSGRELPEIYALK